MGRASGGSFTAGVTSAHSSSGRAEAFGPEALNPRRTSRMDDDTYANTRSYWDRNNQWSWRSSQQEPRHSEYGFFVVFAFFAFFLSLWMFLGLYGSHELEMGMFYSRVMTANPMFVNGIKVHNMREKGPVFYSFSTPPELGLPVPDRESFVDVFVASLHNQRYGFWLNKGSSFDLSYSVKKHGSGTDSLVLAIVRGEEGYQDWKADPSNPSLVLKWKRIHDKGSFSYKVGEDDDYFIVFGNLNSHDMMVSFKLDMRYVLYSVEKADTVCSSQLTDLCEFPLSLGQSTSILVTSPTVNPYGVEHWRVKVSYAPRWSVYVILWGLIGIVLLFTRLTELGRGSLQGSTNHEQAPFLPAEVAEASTEQFGSSTAPSAPPVPSEQADKNQNSGESIPEDQLCTICLDARKDSFFDPCGHRCTCYSCGTRIQRGDTARCPICRQTIRTVRRIYDV